MKALVLRAPGEPLELTELEIDAPQRGEVRIALRATGICHSDLSLASGNLNLGAPMPTVLGHETAGVVTELGPGVEDLAEGDHVVFSFMSPCGTCPVCVGGQPNLCPVTYGGLRPYLRDGDSPVHALSGAYAQEMVTRAATAIKVDPDVPLEVAALLSCGVMTGVGAVINTARLEPGSSVVVLGCGGVGLSVIQGARLAGAAEIVAVDPFESKLEIARQFGATHAVTPDGLADVREDLTGGRGFDYAFEVVGRAETIRTAWDASRRGGTVVVVGAGSAEDHISFNAQELYRMERRLLGSYAGSGYPARDFPRLLNLWRHGQLNIEGLISQRIGLAEVPEAFDALERGDVIRTVVEL